ncbi:DUF4124 domain-containing protein [Aestuariirhabdus litorea]|uniref:DUF4124 domain-containing protein n=1 Tax=Aestuariirhabdus litorea TaxID=2528527 RepID=UPI0013E338F3|nr:DUF4124 domain-containing protein [Aestuariirhabdus litorea]
MVLLFRVVILLALAGGVALLVTPPGRVALVEFTPAWLLDLGIGERLEGGSALPASSTTLKVYRWTDQQGVTHYSDRPKEKLNQQ